MNKQQLVTKFLERGILVTPETLNKITEGDDIESIINSTNTVFAKPSQQHPSTFTFKIKQNQQKEKITPKDFIEYYSKKFEALKNILVQKADAVSINNLQQEREACIIGMVGDKTSRGFHIEDQTGRLEAVCSEPQKQSAVLGFKGVLKDKTFVVKDLVYPDIPLSKQSTTHQKLTLTTKQTTDTNNLTISPNNKEKADNLISNFPLPTTVTISMNQQQTTVLIFQPHEPTNKNQATQHLKLRCLPETNIPNQNNIIEEVPDIFWIIQQDEWKENYKGVMIVSGETVNL